MKVVLEKTVGFTPTELQKLSDAAKLLEMVVNTDNFKKAVLLHIYTEPGGLFKRSKTLNAFRMTSLTPMQVYKKFMSGSERLDPKPDGEADIHISIDRRDAGDVLGYTYASTPMQWVYSSFFGRATLADIASNLAHEYCHKLGFTHESNYTKLRQYTVPYAIGRIVKEIAKGYNYERKI